MNVGEMRARHSICIHNPPCCYPLADPGSDSSVLDCCRPYCKARIKKKRSHHQRFYRRKEPVVATTRYHYLPPYSSELHHRCIRGKNRPWNHPDSSKYQRSSKLRMKHWSDSSSCEAGSGTSQFTSLSVDVSCEMAAVNKDIEAILERYEKAFDSSLAEEIQYRVLTKERGRRPCRHKKPSLGQASGPGGLTQEQLKILSMDKPPLERLKEVPVEYLKPRPPFHLKEKNPRPIPTPAPKGKELPKPRQQTSETLPPRKKEDISKSKDIGGRGEPHRSSSASNLLEGMWRDMVGRGLVDKHDEIGKNVKPFFTEVQNFNEDLLLPMKQQEKSNLATTTEKNVESPIPNAEVENNASCYQKSSASIATQTPSDFEGTFFGRKSTTGGEDMEKKLDFQTDEPVYPTADNNWRQLLENEKTKSVTSSLEISQKPTSPKSSRPQEKVEENLSNKESMDRYSPRSSTMERGDAENLLCHNKSERTASEIPVRTLLDTAKQFEASYNKQKVGTQDEGRRKENEIRFLENDPKSSGDARRKNDWLTEMYLETKESRNKNTSVSAGDGLYLPPLGQKELNVYSLHSSQMEPKYDPYQKNFTNLYSSNTMKKGDLSLKNGLRRDLKESQSFLQASGPPSPEMTQNRKSEHMFSSCMSTGEGGHKLKQGGDVHGDLASTVSSKKEKMSELTQSYLEKCTGAPHGSPRQPNPPRMAPDPLNINLSSLDLMSKNYGAGDSLQNPVTPSRNYIINMIDDVVRKTQDEKGGKAAAQEPPQTTEELDRMDSSFCVEIIRRLTELMMKCELPKNPNESRDFYLPSRFLYYFNLLKKLRTDHLKHIQKEVKHIEDLDRFLSSFGLNSHHMYTGENTFPYCDEK